MTDDDNRKIYAGLPVTALTLVAALAAGGALATGGAAASEAQARYQQERAVCLAGESGQDRETCLREAGAAYAAARHGKVESETADYARNALKRCVPLPDEERLACEARMRGLGTTSGSVSGDGILRQLVTVEVESVSDDAPARK